MASIADVNFNCGVILNKTIDAIVRDGGFTSVNGTSMNNTEGQGVTNGVCNALNFGDTDINRQPIVGNCDLDLSLVTLGDYGITTFAASKDHVFGWFYLQYTAHPTGNTALLLRLRDASTLVLQLSITTAGNLRLGHGASATLVGTNYALSTGTLYRIGFEYKKSTGSDGIYRMWVATGPADGAFSGTPDRELTTATETNSVTLCRLGNQATDSTVNMRVACLRLDDAAMPTVVTLPVSYYVAKTGSDANTGLDTAHPVLTIDKAIELHKTAAAAGNRIYVRSGTYQENLSSYSGSSTVQAGTANQRCLIRNYPGETVWVRGGMRMRTASYWTWRGLGFEWDPALTAGGDPSHMCQLTEKAQYHEVAKCHFRNAAAFADLLLTDGGYGWIHHCWFEDTVNPGGHTSHQDHNIYMSSKDGENGANGYEGEHHCLIEYCLLTGTANGRGTKLGAISDGQGDPHHNTIRYCTYYGNYGPGQIQLSFGANNNTFDHNIMQKPETTSYYNVEYSTSSFQLDGTGNTVKNTYGWQCAGVVHTLTTCLTDGGGNVRADPVWDSEYFPSLAAILTSSKPQFGHLLGLTAASSWPFDVTPTPTTTSISPSTIQAGSAQFTITVNGTEFDNDTVDASNSAVVLFNGTACTTTFVTATQVTAVVPAALITSAGAVNVAVKNPRGNNTSNNQTFTISPPPTDPFISSLSPSTCIAGAAQFTLTVSGVNFDATCVVKFGGTNRTTTFVSAFSITAVIPAAAVSSSGDKDVIVTKTGASDSNTATFSVTASAPILTSISPDTKPAQAANFTLTVNGTGFDGTSTIRFAGVDMTTTHTSSTVLSCTVASTDIPTAGGYAVTVNLPTSESNALTFTATEAPDPPNDTSIKRRFISGPWRWKLLPW